MQERVWEDRGDVVRLFDAGAHVYVCGAQVISEGAKQTAMKIYRDEAEKRCGATTTEQVEKSFADVRRNRYAVDVSG